MKWETELHIPPHSADGPWQVKDQAGEVVAIVYPDGNGGDGERKTAELISAAPALLKANKLTLRNVEAMLYALPVKTDAQARQSLETWANIVRAAIAKAAGES